MIGFTFSWNAPFRRILAFFGGFFNDICHFFQAKNTAPCSILFMEPEIVFVPSAFKHGFSEADIRWAIRTRIRDVLVDNQTREVYHAMRCRKSFQKKYGIEGEDHATFDR